MGLEAVVEYVPPLTREDRRSLALHRAIARRLEEEPEPTLRQARSNLEKMARQHAGARPLLSRWRTLLGRPIEEILEVLVDPRPSARELRHVTPFAGVLSARERASVYRQFSRRRRNVHETQRVRARDPRGRFDPGHRQGARDRQSGLHASLGADLPEAAQRLVEVDVAVPATLGSCLSTVKELDEAVERSVR